MRVGLHGSYYPNNFGDQLILYIQANWIRELSSSEIVLPFATLEYRNAIQSIDETGTKGLASCSKLVYGAGGYLGEPPDKNYNWDLRFLKRHVLAGEFAKWKKIPMAILGAGAGPITNRLVKSEVIRLCKWSAVIAVRDSDSFNFLIANGVDENKVYETADVALSLTMDDLPCDTLEEADRLLPYSNGPYYGLHVGANIDSPLYRNKALLMIEDFAKFFSKNKDIKPVLIVDNDTPIQRAAVEYAQEKIGKSCLVYIHSNFNLTCALLSRLNLVVTNKLHVGIAAYALGTHAISFNLHTKTEKFYRQIGQEKNCLPFENITKNTVLEKLEETLEISWRSDQELTRSKLLPNLRAKALKNRDLLSDFLKR